MPQILQIFGNVVVAHLPMIPFLSAIVSFFSFRIRSRAALELEVIALRHQLGVLKRRRPYRARFLFADRLLWIWLCRIWPQAINVMVLVKPTTVMQWHRRGFRLAWRWRSGALRPGRPKVASDARDLIRQMSTANPLWGAPRIHGELLKLGIKVSQATVGGYMPWRPKEPSPTWRSFLRNHITELAAVDMFVVATATFGLLCAVIVLDHRRRRIVHFEVTQRACAGTRTANKPRGASHAELTSPHVVWANRCGRVWVRVV
jgi:putative transposase